MDWVVDASNSVYRTWKPRKKTRAVEIRRYKGRKTSRQQLMKTIREILKGVAMQ